MTTGVRLERRCSVGELAHVLGGAVDEAAAGRFVERIVAADGAGAAEDLVVVIAPRYVEHARRTEGVLLCDAALARRLPPGRRWAHELPWWVVAELVRHAGGPEVRPGSASVHPGARVHPTAIVGAGAVIHPGVEVGEAAVVGEHAVLYSGVGVGRRASIGAQSVIGRAGFGYGRGPGGVMRLPHAGGVAIEDDVEVGPFCTIDAGTLRPTRIGAGARLDAHVHVGHNVEIGPGSFVAAQVGFAGSTVLGAGVHVGGQAGFADHVRVGDGARVAAKSGVIGDIKADAVVAGFPAVSRMRWLRAMAKLLRG